MGRTKNDGLGRLGGRAKGTPNKVTATMREWLSRLIEKNRRQIERDLKSLEPRDRLVMLEKLMGYVIPKQQAVRAEVELGSLTDAQLDEIVNELTMGIDADDSQRVDADGCNEPLNQS